MGKKSKPEEFKEEKEEVIKEEEEIKRKKKEKKDKKKKRKAAEVEGEEEEVAVEEVGGERSDEVIEKKSKKKDKKDRNDRKEEELVFDRYVPHEEVNAMSEEEAAAFRLNLGTRHYEYSTHSLKYLSNDFTSISPLNSPLLLYIIAFSLSLSFISLYRTLYFSIPV